MDLKAQREGILTGLSCQVQSEVHCNLLGQTNTLAVLGSIRPMWISFFCCLIDLSLSQELLNSAGNWIGYFYFSFKAFIMLKSIHKPLSAAKEKLFTWERNAICDLP